MLNVFINFVFGCGFYEIKVFIWVLSLLVKRLIFGLLKRDIIFWNIGFESIYLRFKFKFWDSWFVFILLDFGIWVVDN